MITAMVMPGDLDRGEEQRVVPDRLVPGVAMVRVHGVELRHVAFFATEELDDLHARHALLDVGVDPRDADADLAEGFAHLQPEEECGDGEHRHDREGPEREGGLEQDQHRSITEHLDHVGDQRDEP